MKGKTLKIGLTGGIGSGKTTVAKIIASLGYPIYFSDQQASQLMNTSSLIRQQLQARFGDKLYDATGLLDKPRLATIIFHDHTALQEVNRIVHPVVLQDFEQWCSRQISTLLFFESAILFEAKLTQHFDQIISIHADIETRITRVIQRDHCTREQVLARIHNQLDDKFKQEQARHVINNNNGCMILQQALDIIERLLALNKG